MKQEKFDHVTNIITVFLLGITTLLTSYASWQSSLYSGQQSSKYTQATTILSESNSLYNQAAQLLENDMNVYNEILNMNYDIEYARKSNNEAETKRLEDKLAMYEKNNVSTDLKTAIDWAKTQPEGTTPFASQDLMDSYYNDAKIKKDEGTALLNSGQEDNSHSDVLGLSTVIYSTVLFLLGLMSSIKSSKLKVTMLIFSGILVVYAAALMFSVPMLNL